MIYKSFQVQKSKQIGNLGEKIALKYFQKKGFNYVKNNYYAQGGEIDLIVEKDGALIFVEVKTRTSNYFGLGEDAINFHKKRKVIRTIFKFLEENNIQCHWQLDVLSVKINPQKKSAQIKHFPDILNV